MRSMGVVVCVLGLLVVSVAPASAYTYVAGDYWRAGRDWTAAANPDGDYYGTPAVWAYQYSTNDADFNPANHTNMATWVGSEWRAAPGTDPGYYARLGASSGHPDDAADPIRTWTSPVYGNVRISGSATNTDANGGDGIRPYIHQGTTQLWTADLPNGGAASYNFIARVRPGDKIAFRVNPKTNQGNDSFAFDPTLTYMNTVSYQAGDTWRPTQDWTAGQNPDDDAYGTPDVWRYQYNPDETDFNPASNLDMGWRGSYWSAAASAPGNYARWYSNGGGHADDAADPILAWTSPISATVTIAGTLTNTDGGGGDGVIGYVHKNTTQLWTGAAANGGSAPAINTTVRVRPGDQLFFRVNSGISQGYDTFAWNPQIAYVAPYGLIGEWKCNEGSGAAQDSSGANYGSGGLPISLSNFSGAAGWTSPGVDPTVASASGSALTTGVGGRITADRSFTIAPGQQGITLEGWIRYHGGPPSAAHTRNYVIDTSGAAMLILQQRGNDWCAYGSSYIDTGGSLSWTGVLGTTPLEEDRWYHMATTYDGTTARLYLDGELEGSRLLAGTLHPGSKSLSVGLNHATWWSDADADYIRMWDYALSADEIRQHFALVKPEPATVLLLGPTVLALVRRRRKR